MVWWQVILFPFAILYDQITRFRNHLFTIGYTRAFEFEVNTIVVGNLSVGGTGKTPMVSYLIEQLGNEFPMATLSRGYGRKSKGFRIASPEVTPVEIGDEPFLFYQRHGKEVTVSVCEDRAYAIPALLYEVPETQLILLDDGFQHRTVKPDINLLMTRYDRPFYHDYLLPSGQLRESRTGAKRADAILVTKCPDDLELSRKEAIKKEIRRYAEAPVYFTKVSYQDPIPFDPETPKSQVPRKYVVVAGIAKNDDFIQYCTSTYLIQHTLSFPDHHTYSDKDIDQIAAALAPDIGLLTTEKDWVKLNSAKVLQGFACYYVPIKTIFLEDEDKFLQEVKNSLKEYAHEAFVQQQDH